MSYLSDDLLRAMDTARSNIGRSARQLTLHAGTRAYPIARLWSGGFAIAVADGPKLGGRVDLYDGARHLTAGTITKAWSEGAERIYAFEWDKTRVMAPALDYIKPDPVDAVLAK